MIATTLRTAFRHLNLSCFAAVTATLLAVALSAPASAVSSSVRNACMGDYFSFCAGMEVGSAELKRCFNRNGAKLSSGCVSALISAGEVSQAEVNRRSGASKTARASTKSKSATRMASRSACVQGPARPGARSSNTCRAGAVASSGRGRRQVATLR